MGTVKPYSLFIDQDVYLFREGKHYRLYEKFGSHTLEHEGKKGTYFSVWAPNAKRVSVIGNFNSWHSESHVLFPRWDGSGIWEGFIEGLSWGTLYKYAVRTSKDELLEKSDPFALSWEQNIQASSLISSTWYEWKDKAWMDTRAKKNSLKAPLSVYELHLGSWLRDTKNPSRFLSYKEIEESLVPYILEMGFTHVEFMPVMEHPYEPSWGYQITGFYAANSRFGSPQDLMHLIESLHRNGIGVILDWVPSHFPGDGNGLHYFDGTFLFEHEDPRKGYHPQWNSHLFNYGRPEVKSFLISNALFWLDRYHADGLRVDAVTSMLYLDYAREPGEWIPNEHGGNVNLEAKAFLQDLNTAIDEHFPQTLTIAEESSDFPKLTKPVQEGGVGFDMKWMMGWMHDTLSYFSSEYSQRKELHHKLTFSSVYKDNEKYMMPLSHDEVVHGKSPLIYKMPGDEWQKFANLRALYSYMYTHPGAKLLFMGGEFGQTSEWDFSKSLDWSLLEHKVHKGLQLLVKDLNRLYKTQRALFEAQFSPEGFEWVEADDIENSVYAFLRKTNSKSEGYEQILVILNLKPRVLEYRLGANYGASWEILLNSDDSNYGGSGQKVVFSSRKEEPWKNHNESYLVSLPPLSAVVLKRGESLREKE